MSFFIVAIEELAKSEKGQDFFGFVKQTVRFSSIGAIGEQSMGQTAFIQAAIKENNRRINKEQEVAKDAADIEATLGRLDKLEAKAKGSNL